MTPSYQGVVSRWVLSEVPADFSLGSDIPESIQRALYGREVRTREALERFFHPSTGHLPDIQLLQEVDKALELLHAAIQQGTFIYVVGDYDVDGTTSAALIGSFLQALGHQRFFLHLPDRFKEGYGVSDHAVTDAIAKGTGLFIAVDCGTKDIPRLQRLKAHGIRTIVIDHHAIGPADELPPADAFVNPQRPDSAYPNPYPSAGALTYRLLDAYRAVYGKPEDWEGVDLAAISLLADIMPLIGENRLLVQLGLNHLQRAPRPGLSILAEKARLSLSGTIRSRSIVFQLVPRLNAPGRLKNPRYSLYLLLARQRDEKLEQVATYLDELNAYRQRLQQAGVEKALMLLERQYPGILSGAVPPPPALVVASSDWNKGVIGLVAAKLMERFYRPSVVFTGSGDILYGSARSPAEIPLYHVLNSYCKPFMLRFGGHDKAAGLSIRREDLAAFTQTFQAGCAVYGADLVPTGVIDAIITPEELQRDQLAQWSERFEPIGPRNEAPHFLLRGLTFRPENGRMYFAHGSIALYDAWAEDKVSERLLTFLQGKAGQPLSLVVTPRLSATGRTTLRLRDVLLDHPNP